MRLVDLKRIQHEHPEYKKRKEQWNFFMQSYEGGYDYIEEGNIFSHAREHEEDYQDRLDRAYYLNYCGPIIDIYAGHLFKYPPSRKTEKHAQLLEETGFLDDVDRQGNSINAFMKRAAILAMVFGQCGIVVDKPSIEARTQMDELRLGAIPYFSIIDPRAVIDWAADEYLELYWIRYREIITESEDPWAEPPKIVRYRTWTRQEWFVHQETEDGAKLIAQGEHGLGIVPFVWLYNKRKHSNPIIGVSAIEDIAYLNREIVNIASLIDEFLYKQCFNVLVMPESLRDTENPSSELEMGTSNVLFYPAEAPQPSYLTPPTDPAQYMQDWIERLVMEIYRLARLETRDAEIKAQSGVAKAWDFHETNQSLAEKADNLEEAERRMWDLWCRWQGLESDFVIDYPEEFDVRTINEEIEEALKLDTLRLSPTFKAEFKKKLVRRLDDKIPPELMQRIDEEIDAMERGMIAVTPEEEEEVARAVERAVS